jgi:hypothetical protein
VPPKLRLADPDAYTAQLAVKQQQLEYKRQQMVLEKMVRVHAGGVEWPACLAGALCAARLSATACAREADDFTCCHGCGCWVCAVQQGIWAALFGGRAAGESP